jgi:hypothetical protein
MRLDAAKRGLPMKPRRLLHLTFIALIASAAASVPLVSGATAAVDRDARVAAASLTMSSDPGDYVGQGLSYSYETPSDVFLAGTDATGTGVRIREISPNFSHYWELDFSAPDGQQLTPGTYPDAVRNVSQGPGQPGLNVSGFGGCNRLSGSFTVLDATYGPDGYVQNFHATFEQHCEGNIPALRGEVQIANTSPPPPPATVQITIDPAGELGAHGTAIVHGTISCSVPPYNPYDPSAAPIISVTVTEQTKSGTISLGNAAYPPSCTPTPTPWTATTPLPYKGTPYAKGAATVAASTTIADPIYPLLFDTGSATTQVLLNEK